MLVLADMMGMQRTLMDTCIILMLWASFDSIEIKNPIFLSFDAEIIAFFLGIPVNLGKMC